MERRINSSLLILSIGDITEESTDAIVNAANRRLVGGGGVDGAIHRAGGPTIMQQCRTIGGCPTGKAVITTGGLLKARYIIHAVGPRYSDGNHGEEALLKSAYVESLRLASKKNLRSISLPAISTGAYGYPTSEAARIALHAVIDYLKAHEDIALVRFVLYDQTIYDVFAKELERLA